MNLIDMKHTGTDSDSLVASDGDQPDYPWGLTLELNDEVLTKLGLDSLPSVGSSMQLQARVKITSVGENESDSGGKSRHVSLQITALALGSAADQTSPAERLFGGG